MILSMPQEVEVWYLLPALRRELARCFVTKHALSQKEAASLLGLTESAISQYLSQKRAHDMKFSKQEKEQISAAADRISAEPAHAQHHLYDLSKSFRGSQALCAAHRKHNSEIPKNCTVCRDDLIHLSKKLRL